MCLGDLVIYENSPSTSRLMRHLTLAGIVIGTNTLTGCYVVPIHPHHGANSAVYMPAQMTAPVPMTFTARLYPSNDLASAYGMVSAVVTNDLNGHGTFTTAINGENFTGEATRTAGSSHGGQANGAGNRGSYINCRYQMNSRTPSHWAPDNADCPTAHCSPCTSAIDSTDSGVLHPFDLSVLFHTTPNQ